MLVYKYFRASLSLSTSASYMATMRIIVKRYIGKGSVPVTVIVKGRSIETTTVRIPRWVAILVEATPPTTPPSYVQGVRVVVRRTEWWSVRPCSNNMASGIPPITGSTATGVS